MLYYNPALQIRFIHLNTYLLLTEFEGRTYGLLTKCKVKMAGYWPSCFIACLWTETESRSINTQKKNEVDSSILSARVANHSAGFDSCCPLTELAI